MIGAGLLSGWTGVAEADTIAIPNSSFESPAVPAVTPYASPEMDGWQKSDQPAWYDPAQNSDTPWAYLMGEFFNVPFPGQFIDNCDGAQAAFFFALPGAALFQDYDTVSGTNTTPTHAFNARFVAGRSYDLTVGVIGGGGNMKPGVTLELSLYYRDAANNKIAVASTSLTNTVDVFPTNTHLVDFRVQVPVVKEGDAWAGQNIGIQMLSTVGFDLLGGYWDLDNVRLVETVPPALSLGHPTVTNSQFAFTLLSDPGVAFELQAATNVNAAAGDWVTLGTFTNVTGVTALTDMTTNFSQRYYRARRL